MEILVLKITILIDYYIRTCNSGNYIITCSYNDLNIFNKITVNYNIIC